MFPEALFVSSASYKFSKKVQTLYCRWWSALCCSMRRICSRSIWKLESPDTSTGASKLFWCVSNSSKSNNLTLWPQSFNQLSKQTQITFLSTMCLNLLRKCFCVLLFCGKWLSYWMLLTSTSLFKGLSHILVTISFICGIWGPKICNNWGDHLGMRRCILVYVYKKAA